MTDTTEVTSDAKLCAQCQSPFGDEDDSRYNHCLACRQPEPIHTAELAVGTVPEQVDDGIVPLHLDIEKQRPPPPEERSCYWIGVTKDCPWSFVACGGVSFQRTTGGIIETTPGHQECRDHVHKGSPVHRLTDAHVARILEEVASKVVRNYRVDRRKLDDETVIETIYGRKHSMKTPEQGGHPLRHFTPQEGDRPLGEFLWMIKVRHKNDVPNMDNPPTLVPR